jgi:hypothetical protein
MIRTSRVFLIVEAVAFVTAALTHFGFLFAGYAHYRAGIAESAIAFALLLGLAVSFVRPTLTASAVLAAQAFALLGTLVGIFTIIIGVGPRTVPDVAYHIAIVVVLATGIVVTSRGRAGGPGLSRAR